MTVRPFLVVLVPERVEGALLGAGVGPRGTDRPALQRPMQAFVRAVLLRGRGMNALMLNAEPIHQTLRADKPHSPRVTNGAPLSVRIPRGSPYSRHVRSNTGRARAPCTEGSP